MTHDDKRDARIQPQDDRRDYFRISDEIGIEVIEVETSAECDTNPFVESHLDALQAELKKLDADIKAQIALLAEKDRLTTGLLKSMNAKIDTLARIIAFEQKPLQHGDWKTVTLSEGGLSFETDSHWAVGQHLAFRLTLPPELSRAVAIGTVIDAENSDAKGRNRFSVEFTRITDHDRQIIARHVMRWQIRQRKND